MYQYNCEEALAIEVSNNSALLAELKDVRNQLIELNIAMSTLLDKKEKLQNTIHSLNNILETNTS